jgi:hypothetical protein
VAKVFGNFADGARGCEGVAGFTATCDEVRFFPARDAGSFRDAGALLVVAGAARSEPRRVGAFRALVPRVAVWLEPGRFAAAAFRIGAAVPVRRPVAFAGAAPFLAATARGAPPRVDGAFFAALPGVVRAAVRGVAFSGLRGPVASFRVTAFFVARFVAGFVAAFFAAAFFVTAFLRGVVVVGRLARVLAPRALRAGFAVAMRASSGVVFEILHFPFVLLRGGAGLERAEVTPLVGLRVLLA